MLSFDVSPAMQRWEELVHENKVLESRYDEAMAEISRLKKAYLIYRDEMEGVSR